MHTKIKEYVLAFVIIATFITYYFDLLKDGMMMSGIFAVVIMVYISMLWAEKIEDERDEYIRSKVDRILYIHIGYSTWRYNLQNLQPSKLYE